MHEQSSLHLRNVSLTTRAHLLTQPHFSSAALPHLRNESRDSSASTSIFDIGRLSALTTWGSCSSDRLSTTMEPAPGTRSDRTRRRARSSGAGR